MIVGISDWKDLQTGRDLSKPEQEKWPVMIYVNVYKDGCLWVNFQPMYFRYHNGDAADTSLKFISDELLKKYEDETEPVYAYLSDSDAYARTSQSVNYVIDAVYALQGGSGDGLKYKYNWLTDYGGKLDNVKGGSTIDVYVTSVYQVEYYLDDVLLEGPAWDDEALYTSPDTDKAFAEKADSASYAVTGYEYGNGNTVTAWAG